MAPTHLTETIFGEEFDAVRLNRHGVHRLPAPVFEVSTALNMARYYATLVAGGRRPRPANVNRGAEIDAWYPNNGLNQVFSMPGQPGF